MNDAILFHSFFQNKELLLSELAQTFGEFLVTGRLHPNYISQLERAYQELPELEEFLNLFVEDTIIMLQQMRRPVIPGTTTQKSNLDSKVTPIGSRRQ